MTMNSTEMNDSQGGVLNTHGTPSLLEILSYKRRLIYVPSIIYTFMLLIIGIPGNATVFYIYFTRWKRSSTRVFIITLSILDLTNCTLTFPFELATMLNPFTYDYSVACKLFRFTTYVCNSGGALLLIAIAVDRYQRICKPFSKPMDPRTAKIVSIVITVVSAFTCWPALIIYGTEIKTIPPSTQLKFCLIENQYRSTKYPLAYLLVQCACTLVIFAILVIIYSVIGAQVCRRWKFRTRSTKSVSDEDNDVRIDVSHCDDTVKESDDDIWKDNDKTTDLADTKTGDISHHKACDSAARLQTHTSTLLKRKSKALDTRTIRIGKTTIMLFIITVAYILCFSPFLGLASHRSVYPERWRNMSQTDEMVYNFFLRSYLANCAINPIVYSFFNKIFRKECVNFFKKLFCTKPSCSGN